MVLTDRDALIKRFKDMWMIHCESQNDLAKEIGISYNTLKRFLNGGPILETTLLRIERWVEDMEFDYGRAANEG